LFKRILHGGGGGFLVGRFGSFVLATSRQDEDGQGEEERAGKGVQETHHRFLLRHQRAEGNLDVWVPSRGMAAGKWGDGGGLFSSDFRLPERAEKTHYCVGKIR